MQTTQFAILGTGSWGTALAIVLARNGFAVRMWGKFLEELEDLQRDRENKHYLPGIALPENIEIFSDIQATLLGCDNILLAVPSHVFIDTLELIKPYLSKNARLLWGTKGIDGQGELMHVAVEKILGKIPAAVISGPTFAMEVAKGLPTAVTVAATNSDFAKEIADYFHSETFRVYTSGDIIGVEIGGAVKNVLAIAVGISDGLGFGSNARCALITRGLAELTRLGMKLGGKMETFMGLTGLGDLVLTCTDNQSRNRRFGLCIGKGSSRAEAEKSIDQVIEGIVNAKLIYDLARSSNVEMPITEQVYQVLYEDLPLRKAVDSLLGRERKSEV